MIAVAFSRVAGRLLVADPGLVRLHTALRVTLACLLSGVVCVAWTAGHHQPLTLAALGVLFSMIAPLFVRDARRSERLLRSGGMFGFSRMISGQNSLCPAKRAKFAVFHVGILKAVAARARTWGWI